MTQAAKIAKRHAERTTESRFEPPALSLEPTIETPAPAESAASYSIATTDVMPGLRSVTPKTQRKKNDDGGPAPASIPAPPTDAPGANPKQLNAGATGTTNILAPTVSSKTYSGRTLQDVSNALPEESGSLTLDIGAATDGDRVSSAPRQHEDGHVKINLQQRGSAHTRFTGRPKSETEDVTTELENETFAANTAFDTQTDHGKSGSPSTTIDVRAKCDDKGTSTEAGGEEDLVQMKLEVSEPGDPDEEEADRIADQVMRMAEPRPADGAGTKRTIQRKARGESPPPPVSPGVTAVTRNGGRPLDPEIRAFMEPRFGFDFSRVRVHVDSEAAESARSIDARAYTLGNDVVFGAGQYAPETTDGRRLLAHELTHVVQQGSTHTSEASAISTAPSHVVQRDTPAAAPAPAAQTGASPAPAAAPDTAGMSPDDARRLVYARTTLSQVPALEARDKDTLQQATKDALVFSFIEKRNEKRKELEQATKEYQSLIDNQKDKSGPPTEKENQEKDDLKKRVDKLDEEVKNLDGLIKPILNTLGVGEDQLVKLVSETFPDMFVARGKKIAIQQLQTNKEMAERERDKYQDVAGAGDVGKPKIDGLRNAARDLATRRKAIEQLQLQVREADKDKPSGGLADPSQQNSSAYDLARKDQIQADIEQKQQDLNATRQTYARDYQILYRDDVDLDKLAVASDDELRATVGSKVDDILDNIIKTQKNIEDGKIKIWSLQDVVSMTTQDLGVGGNPTLMSVITRRREQEEKEAQADEDFASALKAFALTAAAIASLITLNPAPLLVMGFIVGTIDVIQQGGQAIRVSAARDVALDPAVAQMTSEEPGWGWLIISIAGLLLDAVTGASLLRQHFKALKAAAQTLEAFSAAARRAFPEKEAERLIEIARRELKAGLNLTEEIAAIGGAFKESERVRIGLALVKYMPEGYTEAFLQLSAEARIVTLSEEGIRAAYGDAARAEAMIAKHPPGRSGGFYDKGLNRGTAFVKDQGTVLEIGESVAHELTHNFQKATGILEPLRPALASMEFYEEMQAFKMQQGFIQKAAAEYGETAIPENSKWLVKASDQEIAEQVTTRYRVRPDPEVGIQSPITDDLINRMLQRTMKGIDMRKEVMRRLEERLPNE